MRGPLIAIAALAAALPLAVEAPEGGSERRGETRAAVAAGTGYYAIIQHGCEGQVLNEVTARVQDASATVEHRFPSGPALGVRGGVTKTRIEGVDSHNRYVNPFLGWERDHFGAGLGVFASEHELIGREGETFRLPVSGHLRFGNPRVSIALRVAESEPLVTGGGYYTAGFDLGGDQPFGGYFGISMGPFDGAGALLSARYRFPNGAGVRLNGRFGVTDNYGEHTGSIAFDYRFR